MKNNPRLKICGMRDAENIMQVAKLQPVYMGFIFYPKSPRYVGEDFQIPANFPATIRKVGVFVNETTDQILKQVHRLGLAYVQLHGDEPVEQVRSLHEKGVKVIKVFSVGDDFDFAVTRPYREVVDYFLFDTKGKYYGGNAQVFDWTMLKQYDQEVPFFLSGGIGPDNVENMTTLSGMNLHALDVNSGVESKPGLKDLDKIEKLNRVIDLIR
jgi:phosphoribosylanthranilate isomerase